MTEEAKPQSTGIKQMEARKGRLWGFIRSEARAKGHVEPLSESVTAGRLRHLFFSSIKTISDFMKSKVGEGALTEMFEYQGQAYGSRKTEWKWTAERIAQDMIKQNFQPLGIEAEYAGGDQEAEIVIKYCPLPQRFIEEPMFISTIYPLESGKPMLAEFGSGLVAKGEWPPRKTEVCALCKIVTPKTVERLGYDWSYELKEVPGEVRKYCTFKIKMRP